MMPPRARFGPLTTLRTLELLGFGSQCLILGALLRRLCSYTGCMWLGCLRRLGTALGTESSDDDRLHPP